MTQEDRERLERVEAKLDELLSIVRPRSRRRKRPAPPVEISQLDRARAQEVLRRLGMA
jgi:hypothetical protein